MERGRLGELVRRRCRAHFGMSSTNRTRRFVVRLPLTPSCRAEDGVGGVAGYPRGTGGGRGGHRAARMPPWLWPPRATPVSSDPWLRYCVGRNSVMIPGPANWALPAAGVTLAVSPLRTPSGLPFATGLGLSFMRRSAVAQLRSDGRGVVTVGTFGCVLTFGRYQGGSSFLKR